MKRKSVYKNIDFIAYPLCCIPLQSSFLMIYTILNALVPAYETVAIANFIDCAIDIFGGKRNSAEILRPIAMIVIYILFVNLMPSIANIISLTGKNKMTIKMKELILEKRASLEYMHIENAQTQELINRVCSDPVGNFTSGFNNILTATSIMISSISLLGIIMTSAFISGIIIIIVIVPLIAIAMRVGRKNYEMNKETRKILRRYKYISDILTGREYATERKLFGYSKSLQHYYNDLYDQSYKIESKIEKKTYANMKSGAMVTILVNAVIVFILLPSLNEGSISIGAFVGLVNAFFSLVQTMSWKLSGVMIEYSRLKEYLKDLNAFFALSEKANSCVKPSSTEDFIFESLEFCNVSFKYPETENYVLKNCSFLLNSGKCYSIVGINGAGKSTITKIIIGLYDDYEGEILLNGISIRQYDYATVKGIISVLFQDFTSYAISMKDNIVIGRNMIYKEEEMKRIISQVGLEQLVDELHNQMETSLGKLKKDSVDLSGGQWQRIAISRLLYSEAKIIILDEPTASLDPIAESQVYEMFHRVSNNRFTIYITHRLGAAKIADEILVVDTGKIVEQGSHEELMKIPNGLYSKMFDSQKSWYE